MAVVTVRSATRANVPAVAEIWYHGWRDGHDVAQEHRGTGVAPRLLSEGERLVAASGFEQAWLAVVAGNMRARRFYERSGWIDEGAFEYLAAGPGGTISVPARRYVKRVIAHPDGDA